MVTKKEKIELLEAIRAEKKKYEVLLQGYGGEIAIGSITKEQYEFWKDREDLDEYAYDWDGEIEIPESMRIFNPGDWYDCDNIAHESGCEFSDICMVTVVDDQGNEVWSSPLSIAALNNNGVYTDGMLSQDEFVEDTDHQYYFLGQNFEKGCFQTYEIETVGKFNPWKINFSIINVNGWTLINGVSYESVELEDTGGYSTTGKSSTFKVYDIEEN